MAKTRGGGRVSSSLRPKAAVSTPHSCQTSMRLKAAVTTPPLSRKSASASLFNQSTGIPCVFSTPTSSISAALAIAAAPVSSISTFPFNNLSSPADADADVLPYPQPASRKKSLGGSRQQKYFVLTSKEAYEAKSKHALEKVQKEQEKEKRKQERLEKQRNKAELDKDKALKKLR